MLEVQVSLLISDTPLSIKEGTPLYPWAGSSVAALCALAERRTGLLCFLWTFAEVEWLVSKSFCFSRLSIFVLLLRESGLFLGLLCQCCWWGLGSSVSTPRQDAL